LGEILPLENPKESIANPTKVFVGNCYILHNFFFEFSIFKPWRYYYPNERKVSSIDNMISNGECFQIGSKQTFGKKTHQNIQKFCKYVKVDLKLSLVPRVINSCFAL
jgi:hypothetical protein